MHRGRIRVEELLYAGIRKTLIEINRDPRSPNPVPKLEDLRVYDLPDYDYGNVPKLPRERRPFSEFKAEIEAARIQG